MQFAEFSTIAKSLPQLRWNTHKSLILSYSEYLGRILIKKINDSLFVSAFDKIVVNEATLLEVVYDKNYEIKQVRYQTMWMDYVPPKGKMLDYVPLLYQYSRENVAGNNESVGCIAPWNGE